MNNYNFAFGIIFMSYPPCFFSAPNCRYPWQPVWHNMSWVPPIGWILSKRRPTSPRLTPPWFEHCYIVDVRCQHWVSKQWSGWERKRPYQTSSVHTQPCSPSNGAGCTTIEFNEINLLTLVWTKREEGRRSSKNSSCGKGHRQHEGLPNSTFDHLSLRN